MITAVIIFIIIIHEYYYGGVVALLLQDHLTNANTDNNTNIYSHNFYRPDAVLDMTPTQQCQRSESRLNN